MFNLSVTGHRPAKIGKDYYDVNSLKSKVMIDFFRSYISFALLTKNEDDSLYCISGMALGVDTLFAIAVLQLQNEGVENLYLTCAIPCANHSSKWQGSSKKVYDAILARANQVVMVSDAPYTNHCMQDRNVYMVDRANHILAIWDGTSGGTGNCVKYAQDKGVGVTIVHPGEIV